MNKEIVTQFQEIAGTEQVLIQEPMKNHTTFRIGGPAACFVRPQDAGQVERILHICRENEVPWFILGNGSNLLVSDRGFDGVIIQIYRNMSRIQVSGHHMTVQAGALLSAVAKQALREGLSGLEFASGIPGTVGGAVVMNAGAYGSEMKDVLTWARVLAPDGAVYRLEAPDHLIVELSGQGTIQDLLSIRSFLPDCQIHQLIYVLNARKFQSLATVMGSGFSGQIQASPVLFLNHWAELSPVEQEAVRTQLHQWNPVARLLTDFGEVDPETNHVLCRSFLSAGAEPMAQTKLPRQSTFRGRPASGASAEMKAFFREKASRQI